MKATFTEDLLGTAPLNPNIYSDYILNSGISPTVPVTDTLDELETVPNGDKGKTGFHRLEDGTPCIYDYVLKGFFKDACAMQARVGESQSKQLKAYKKVIDGLVFVWPRRISICNAGEIGVLERPLRAMTAQGERVALAHSERINAGASITFEVEVLDDKTVPESLLREWLNYGKYRGLGQWRNGSYGRMTYTMKRIE